MKNIVVIGGGFGGLWSAVGAARELDELHVGPDQVAITLIEKNDFHSIRVRNYEENLGVTIVPLKKVLGPIGVKHLQAEVIGVDLQKQQVQVRTAQGSQCVSYDRLVYALGSHVKRPPIPGLVEHSFDVDTYRGARKLESHLNSLSADTSLGDEKYTVLVVGAGLTGIEIATGLAERLDRMVGASRHGKKARVILADSRSIGSNMGEQACKVIDEALADMKIESRPNVAIKSVDAHGVTLADGERILTATVIWCGGMQADGLGASFPVERDHFGRVPVDEYLRVKGVSHVFAAGDVADSTVCAGHESVMSCQHGRPMGRYAGHNVVADLMGEPMLPLRIDWYTTILDLGPWGAVYTEGWDRHVVSTREAAKQTKRTINGHRIYPPLTENRAEILAAAEPVIQAPPATDRTAGAAVPAC
ncbi:MAG TPA: FAD-dependent oxidoreductase [Castellaniella sp.]|uniref:NAD(P)/FAD-dependent oxidoreductase n=1 Tax=Castellaniella sp. TaxID=1955812 RepID=UPI002EDCCF96